VFAPFAADPMGDKGPQNGKCPVTGHHIIQSIEQIQIMFQGVHFRLHVGRARPGTDGYCG
jgi:hypothetical protein